MRVRDDDPSAEHDPVLGPARPAFARRRRGYDPGEVNPYLDMLERERSDLGTALVLIQARVRELSAKLERYEALENELTKSLRLGKQTADAVVADANRRADEVLTQARTESTRILEDGRRRLRQEEHELDHLRLALAAEASNLESLEKRLDTQISRAARALVDIVDAPGGLGPFSQSTATLLEFAQLLQRNARSGTPARVQLAVENGGPVATVLPGDPSQDDAPAHGAAGAVRPAETPTTELDLRVLRGRLSGTPTGQAAS
jgi:DivIVA domain-containing protein